VNEQNLDGAKGVEMLFLQMIIVTNKDQLLVYDNRNFKHIKTIPIPLLTTQTREANEIIGIQKSHCEESLAIISGKNLVMNEQKLNQLFIFKRQTIYETQDHTDIFTLYKRVILKDIPIFDRVCM
jgi:hypothetical protein